MMPDDSETNFIQRTAGEIGRHKKKIAVGTAGTGLSAAAVVWLYMTFATSNHVSEGFEKQSDAAARNWRAIQDFRQEVQEENRELKEQVKQMQACAFAYEVLLHFLKTGEVKILIRETTNQSK